MFFLLKRHLLVVLAAVVAGFGVSSGAVAQEASQTVLTNDQPNRTTVLYGNAGSKVVNPRGFKITITGNDAAIGGDNSTDAFQTEVVNEGPLSTSGGGPGIELGTGGKVINRGPIETAGDSAFGIDVDDSTAKYQSVVENYAPITTKGDNASGINVGYGGKVINRGNITTEGAQAMGIEASGSNANYNLRSVIENYAAITTKGTSAHGIGARSGVTVINRGPIETAGQTAHGISVGGSLNEYQSVVENYAPITTKGNRAQGIKMGDGGKVINRGPIKATGAGATFGIDIDNSTEKYQSVVENYADITATEDTAILGRTGARVLNYGNLTAGKYGISVGASGYVDADGDFSSTGGYQALIENYGDITITGGSGAVLRATTGGRVINWGALHKLPAASGVGIEVLASTTQYQSVVENYGPIKMEGTGSNTIISVGVGGRVLNWGTLEARDANGIFVSGSTAEHQAVVENFGRIILQAKGKTGIQVGSGARVLNRGSILTRGEDGRAIQGYGGAEPGFQAVLENDGSLTTYGFGTAYGIDGVSGFRVINRGSIVTTGGKGKFGSPHGIRYADNPANAKAEEIINEGSIHVSGTGANAIHAGANSIVINRGSLVSRQGKAINFTGGGNRLTLGSESYIVGNINLGTGTRVALDLSGGGSGLWQGEGDLTGEVTASGGRGNMAWAYNKDTGQLAIFDASVFSSGEDTLAAASSGVSDLVGGRLDRLAGVVGGNSRQTAAMDGGMLTGHDAAVGVWFSGGGGIQQFDRYGTTPETTQVSWSGVLGVDYTPLDRSYTVGLFTGYVSNDTWGGAPVNAAPNQRRSFERDDSGVVAGVYGRVYHGSWFADAGLSFGYSDFDHRRWTNDATQDNGLSVLWASQDGWWVRPQLRVGHAIPLQGGWTAIPSLSVSYGRQHLSGYKERGKSGAAMEVKSRTVSFISGGGQLALERAVGRKGTVRFHGGYDYRDSVGSQTTKVRLLGQDRSVTSSSKARHEFSAGIGGSYALGPGIRVEMWGSALFGPDHRGGHGGLDLISHS